jgi:hypothetical protein
LLAVLLDRDEILAASRSEKNRQQEYLGISRKKSGIG